MSKQTPLIFLLTLMSLATLFLAENAQSTFLRPSDRPYFQYRKGETLYIYDESVRKDLSTIVSYSEAMHELYRQSFNWRLDEEQDFIFTSPNQQIANAFATVVPNIKTVWFPTGPGILEELAQSSWFLALTTHELAHLYQLNAKGPVNALTKKVVGNTIVSTPLVFPIFIHPNLFTPTSLLEGNAVLNESRANLGGRLHSGEARALVLSQIAADEIDSSRIINDQFRYPYNETAYLQGGYFQAHLAGKYGIEKTNEFFLAQGNHWLLPLILNRTFRDHFGSSYPQEIREYVRGLEGLAATQKITPGTALVESEFFGSLNHDGERIWFIEGDRRRLPRLWTFNKTTSQIESKPIDLSIAKAFWLDGRPVTASSWAHDFRHIEYSLYGEGQKFYPEARGQIVNDRRAGHQVSLDANDAWLEGRLLLDGEFYDIAHSKPILDDQGHVYYFRQNGAERVLYRDRKPIFKYPGFYGKLMEVDNQGRVYFIANTEVGASLYAYANNEIRRVLASDRVIDARKINDDSFLVSEVGPKGHRLAIAEQMLGTEASPAVYSYPFTNYTLQPKPAPPVEQIQEEEKRYHATREMRFSSLDLFGFVDSSSGLGVTAAAHLTDPLEYQDLQFGGTTSEHGDQSAFAQYTYTRYLLRPFLRYYTERQRLAFNYGNRAWTTNQEGFLGMNIPLRRWQRWTAEMDMAATYQSEGEWKSPNTGRILYPEETTIGSYVAARLQFLNDQGLNFYPLRQFDFSIVNRVEADGNAWKKEHNTSKVESTYRMGFGNELFAYALGTYAWGETQHIWVDYNPYPYTNAIRVSQLTAQNDYRVRSVGAARLELSKVLNFRLYSPRIPFGVDRLSPFVVGQAMTFDRTPNSVYPGALYEWGYGADIQLLLAHRFPLQTRILRGFNNLENKNGVVQATLQFSRNF